MKKREIILDFTSLLDVTLIVIFFFVLFSHLDNQANKEALEKKNDELQVAIDEAEYTKAEAQELKEQLEKEIAIIRYSDKRQAADLSELLNFQNSKNLKIILDMKDTGWSIRMVKDSEVIASVKNSDALADDMISSIAKAGYSNDDTIFCDFVFDGSIPGSHKAYKAIRNSLGKVSEKYKSLYISETDLCIGSEDV